MNIQNEADEAEVEFHPYLLEHLDAVDKIQKQHNIHFQAYGPLTPLLRHPTGGPLKPVLTKIAERLSRDSGKELDETAALLLWTIQKGVSPVTTSTKKERLAQIISVDSLPSLTDEEFAEIERVGRKVHFRAYKEHMTENFPAPNLPEDL